MSGEKTLGQWLGFSCQGDPSSNSGCTNVPAVWPSANGLIFPRIYFWGRLECGDLCGLPSFSGDLEVLVHAGGKLLNTLLCKTSPNPGLTPDSELRIPRDGTQTSIFLKAPQVIPEYSRGWEPTPSALSLDGWPSHCQPRSRATASCACDGCLCLVLCTPALSWQECSGQHRCLVYILTQLWGCFLLGFDS